MFLGGGGLVTLQWGPSGKVLIDLCLTGPGKKLFIARYPINLVMKIKSKFLKVYLSGEYVLTWVPQIHISKKIKLELQFLHFQVYDKIHFSLTDW